MHKTNIKGNSNDFNDPERLFKIKSKRKAEDKY